ncbi:MAG: hypothetical protein ACKOPS_20585 [Cyanobium sp.]
MIAAAAAQVAGQRLAHWPWTQGREVELWRRRAGVPVEAFDGTFIRLARGMERGPAGLRDVFAQIGPARAAGTRAGRTGSTAVDRLPGPPRRPRRGWCRRGW